MSQQDYSPGRSPAFDRTMAVILVNYRSPGDTIECLSSLFAGTRVPYVIVADNASGDGSLETIARWAEGRHELQIEHPFHRMAQDRPITFPIEYEVRGPDDERRPPSKPLTLLQTGSNLGFAGGNNRGLQIASRGEGIDIFWLLNNDTTVGPQTVTAVAEAFASHPQWGMAGTPIRLYHEPTRHQLVNGMRFSKWSAAGAGIDAGSSVDQRFDAGDIIRQTDFVCGASLIMTRPFFETVGELEERFFLYFEEIDLATRAKGRFDIGFVADAIVYHKEGGSAGSASILSKRARSPLSEYHFIRSKMIFARKHYPWLVPLYFAQNLAIMARRALRRQPEQLKAVAKATFGLPL
ncbi:glycosyltransferase family 2 protein [Qipengyuania sp.]|uniref:glycosyltransferase family 2 protein n=1 Tax=Qipengyuania sp. TaxID=2004515 RepID=UPI003734E43D